uniref:Peroxiredoxin C-terminal domain-containing protein n=1 Tax=Glossina palpalis gambiensis TaxID=67801 RepID=A0A1B0BSC8_9MUSC
MIRPLERSLAKLICNSVSVITTSMMGAIGTEILRVINFMQLTGRESLATPVDWNQGHTCMILPTLSNEEASEKYPKGLKTFNISSGKTYIR